MTQEERKALAEEVKRLADKMSSLRLDSIVADPGKPTRDAISRAHAATDEFEQAVDRLASAAPAAQATGEWVMVPREPTREMILAGHTIPLDRVGWDVLKYKAMLSAAPAAQATVTDEQIKAIFLANGFTIKEGLTDLKPYVYAAARALLAAAPAAPVQPSSLGAPASPSGSPLQPPAAASAAIPGAAHVERIEAEHEALLFFASWAHAKLNPTVLTVEEREQMDRINAIVMGGGV